MSNTSTSAAEATNRAAWLPHKQARPLHLDSAPMPHPGPNQLIIRVRAVALNPVDVAVQTRGILHTSYPMVPGCDAAGEVVRLGSDVQGFALGDRVVANMYSGAFALYAAVTLPFAAHIPPALAWRDAAVLPLAFVTAAVCLFERDMLALTFPQLASPPPRNGQLVLVWGGGTSVGSCAIQMARAAGYDVAAVARTHNFAYCRRLGATHVFDYTDEGVFEDVVDALRGRECAGVFCAIFAPGVVGQCARIADGMGGNKFVATVVPPAMPIADPVPEGVRIGKCWSSILRSSEAAREIFATWLPAALANGTMKCAPEAEVVGQGLERIQDGLDRLAEGVSAKKIVVEIP